MHFLAGGECDFISAPIAAANKSGGDFPRRMYGGGIEEEEEEVVVDAHSKYKPLLIQNDMTQAPFLPLLQAYWFYNSLCDVCCKSTGLHTVHTAGKGSTAPQS